MQIEGIAGWIWRSRSDWDGSLERFRLKGTRREPDHYIGLPYTLPALSLFLYYYQEKQIAVVNVIIVLSQSRQ